MILFKNAHIYAPKDLGIMDILVGGKSILVMDKNLSLNVDKLEIVDLEGYNLAPGLIDQHVHITGGGGEAGYHSRTPEIVLSQLLKYGITTVVGVLGTDGCTRSLENLYAKAKALENEGITAFMHTGSYQVPTFTLTGSIMKDLVLIDKVIGVKIAMADNRGSFPTDDELLKIVSQIRVGGLISKKVGILHMHMGALEDKLDAVFRLINDYQFPINYFEPTHCARTKELFNEAMRFQKQGGFIDVTTGGSKFAQIHEVLAYGLENNLNLDKVSLSSDGNGSVPKFDNNSNLIGFGCASCKSNIDVIKDILAHKVLSMEDTIKLMTKNVATFLNLTNKGEIKIGYDADFIVYDNDFNIKDVIAKGDFCIKDEKLIKKGFFE